MSKLKRLFSLLMVFTLICMSLTPVQVSAKTNKSGQTNEDIQKLADELEYIFTNILIKDENTGFYNVNEEALNTSHYTQEERQQFLDYAEQLKQQLKRNNNVNAKSGTFDRCMQDLLGISAGAYKEIKALIDGGNYWSAAATLLFVLEVSVNPITIAIFVATCGPEKAG